jgi:hypothetical protein
MEARGKGKKLYEHVKDNKDGSTETIVVTKHVNGVYTEIYYRDSEGEIKKRRGHFIDTENY